MFKQLLLLFALCLGMGCSTPNLPLSLTYKGYPVNNSTTDTALTNLIQPYGQNVNKTMGTVILWRIVCGKWLQNNTISPLI
jgi:hypothetical protein